MRLINADALGIGKAKREAFTVPEYADGWNSAIEIIDKAPTIDIVLPTRSQFKRMAVQLGYERVVRCNDCKYWKKFNDELRRDGMCEALLNFHGAERYMTNEDFFCSYGERRTDANEPDGT